MDQNSILHWYFIYPFDMYTLWTKWISHLKWHFPSWTNGCAKEKWITFKKNAKPNVQMVSEISVEAICFSIYSDSSIWVHYIFFPQPSSLLLPLRTSCDSANLLYACVFTVVYTYLDFKDPVRLNNSMELNFSAELLYLWGSWIEYQSPFLLNRSILPFFAM